MSKHPYGMRGAPAVGKGLGGLPRRKVSAASITQTIVNKSPIFYFFADTGGNLYIRKLALNGFAGQDQKIAVASGGIWSLCTDMNSNYLFITGTAGGTPLIRIYKRSGSTFNSIGTPTAPTVVNRSAMTRDAVYVAVGQESSLSPLKIYKRVGDVFSLLVEPLPATTAGVSSISFSDDGSLLLVGFDTAPYIRVYSREGDTFTEVSNPNISLSNIVRDAKVSKNNDYMAIGTYEAPYLRIYKKTDGIFSQITNPTTMPTAQTMKVAFSINGNFLAVGNGDNAQGIIYKLNTGTSLFQSVASLPYSSNGVIDISFSREINETINDSDSVILSTQEYVSGLFGRAMAYYDPINNYKYVIAPPVLDTGITPPSNFIRHACISR